MDQVSTIRSVPVNADGTPRDTSLRAGAPAAEASEAPAPLHAIPAPPATIAPAEPSSRPAASPGVSASDRPRARYIGSKILFAKVDLDFPMEFEEVEYHHLTIKPIRGEDFAQFATMVSEGFAANDVIISLSTGAPIGLVRDLFLVDKLNVLEAAAPFLPRQLRRALNIKTREEMEAEEAGNTEPSSGSDTTTGTSG